MKKRSTDVSTAINNFLGFEINVDGCLVSKTNFDCKTERMESNRCCKKTNVKIQWLENRASIIFNKKIKMLTTRTKHYLIMHYHK